MYENTQNLHQLCDLNVRKNKAKKFLWPAIKYFNEICPIRKKSGHRCYSLFSWYFLYQSSTNEKLAYPLRFLTYPWLGTASNGLRECYSFSLFTSRLNFIDKQNFEKHH